MKEKPYHHGNLRTELIEEGLALIHEKGRGDFSLRKLSKRVGVSPTACYNHFANVDELLAEMKNYVTKKFCDALLENIDEREMASAAINMGKSYVNFFASNPHYFTFIYDNEEYRINLTEAAFEGDFAPFNIFRKTAVKCMEYHHIDKERYRDNLLVMWATVHGLAAMANMRGFHYGGDWGLLTETLLETKINLV